MNNDIPERKGFVRVYHWAFHTRPSKTLGKPAAYLAGWTTKEPTGNNGIITSAIVAVDGRDLVTAKGSRYRPTPHRSFKKAGLILPE